MDEKPATSTKLTMDSGGGGIDDLIITVDEDHVLFSGPTDVLVFTHKEWSVIISYVAAEYTILSLAEATP